MLASSSAWFSVPGVLIALFAIVALLAAMRVYFRASTGQALIAQQQVLIETYEARLNEQDRQINALKRQNEEQAEQIRVLTDLVTQKTAVEALTILVRQGFAKLGAGDLK